MNLWRIRAVVKKQQGSGKTGKLTQLMSKIGVFSVLTPKAVMVTLLLLGIALLLVRHLAMSIFLSSPFLLLFIWLFYRSPWLILYALAIVLLLMYRNRHGIPHLKTLRLHRPDFTNLFRRK